MTTQATPSKDVRRPDPERSAPPAAQPAPAATPAAQRRRFSPRHAASAVTEGLVSLVWLAVGIINLVLVLDFVFRMIGASDSGFVHGVYRVGSTLASPFNGIFTNVAHQFNNYTLTWSDLVAMVLCTIAGLILVRIIRAVGPRPRMTPARS